jgi:hypothetical protein
MLWENVKTPGRDLARHVITLLVSYGLISEPTNERGISVANEVAELIRVRLEVAGALPTAAKHSDKLARLHERRSYLLGRRQDVQDRTDPRLDHYDAEIGALDYAIQCVEYVGRVR